MNYYVPVHSIMSDTEYKLETLIKHAKNKETNTNKLTKLNQKVKLKSKYHTSS